MNTDVIIIKQLPIIEEQLLRIKNEVTAATKEALSLVCTEDTVKTVKQARADLNKNFATFEGRRKEVKAQILAPYEAFDAIYRDCITEPFRTADRELAGKITATEAAVKEKKMRDVAEYFVEYRQSIGLGEDDAPIKNAKINVTMSASLKSLKEQARRYLDETREDIAMISTQEDHDEILAEYRKTGNAAQAIMLVAQRHKEIEDERRRTEARKAAEVERAELTAKVEEAITEAVPDAVTAPTVEKEVSVEETPVANYTAAETAISAATEDIYEVTFTVRGTLTQIRAMKEFLDNGGYDYE